MAAGRVVVDLVFELFAFELEGLDEMFDLEVVDVLIVGVRMNEERRVKLLCVVHRRTFAVFGNVVMNGFTEMIRGGVELAVALTLITHARDQIAYGNAGVGDSIVVGVGKDVHQGYETAVTPTH